MLYQQKTILRGLFGAGLVRTVYEYTQLFENRRDPKLTEEAKTYLPNIDRYRAGRLRRIVNYNNENALSHLWCEIENPFWFFVTKVCRHYIWKPHVRALLEEARAKTEKGEC